MKRVNARALKARAAAVLSRFRGQPRSDAPPRTEVGGPLDAVNDDFHDHYAAARAGARHDGPVFVVLADDLVLFHCQTRKAWSFSPHGFHVIKSATHAPVALFVALQRTDDAASGPARGAHLAALRTNTAQALERLDEDARELTERTRADLRHMLSATLSQLDTLQTADPPADSQRRRLDTFGAALGPAVLRLVDDATQLQLDALHAHVEAALEGLSPHDRSALQVVVAGVHQARTRSLAMQYFHKRFGESPEAELRVTYAEGVSDEAAALALVGTRRLDRSLARAFFGDEKRMQRDILGDSARERLANLDVERIV